MPLNTRVAQGGKDGRKVRQHRVIGGLINFRIAQALRQAVPKGRGDAGGAIGWQRRCQLDQDVREHIQSKRLGVAS